MIKSRFKKVLKYFRQMKKILSKQLKPLYKLLDHMPFPPPDAASVFNLVLEEEDCKLKEGQRFKSLSS